MAAALTWYGSRCTWRKHPAAAPWTLSTIALGSLATDDDCALSAAAGIWTPLDQGASRYARVNSQYTDLNISVDLTLDNLYCRSNRSSTVIQCSEPQPKCHFWYSRGKPLPPIPSGKSPADRYGRIQPEGPRVRNFFCHLSLLAPAQKFPCPTERRFSPLLCLT